MIAPSARAEPCRQFSTTPDEIAELDETLVECDFGGQADVWLDAMFDVGRTATNAVLAKLGVEFDGDEFPPF